MYENFVWSLPSIDHFIFKNSRVESTFFCFNEHALQIIELSKVVPSPLAPAPVVRVIHSSAPRLDSAVRMQCLCLRASTRPCRGSCSYLRNFLPSEWTSLSSSSAGPNYPWICCWQDEAVNEEEVSSLWNINNDQCILPHLGPNQAADNATDVLWGKKNKRKAVKAINKKLHQQIKAVCFLFITGVETY